MEPEQGRPGSAQGPSRRLARIGVGPVQGTGIVLGAEADHKWFRLGGYPQDPRVGAVDRSGVDHDGLIAETDVDCAPIFHGDLDQDVPFRVGCDRRWWLDRVRMEAGTGPADVGNLHGFHAGDDDVIRWVLSETLRTGITARGSHNCQQQYTGEKEPTADHRRPI